MKDDAQLGLVLKNRELDGHEDRKERAIDFVRGELKYVWSQRQLRVRYVGESSAGVDADDAREICDDHGIPRGPWLGSIFRGKHWHWTGDVRHSREPMQHARMFKVWRYVQ